MESRGTNTAPPHAQSSERPGTNPRARPFPRAMTEAELRAAYERNPSPEVRRLLWEIARLHALARRAKEVAYGLPLDLLDDLGVAGVRTSPMAPAERTGARSVCGPDQKMAIWPVGRGRGDACLSGAAGLRQARGAPTAQWIARAGPCEHGRAQAAS